MLKHKSFLALALMLLSLFALPVMAQQTTGDKAKELFVAIRSGDNAALEKLLAQGVNVNDSLNGYTPIMAAALNGTAEQMKTLIRHGADINYVSPNELCALWLAAHDRDKLNVLLDNGVNIHQRIRGYSILVKLAAMPGTGKNIQLLIDKGIDPKRSAPDNYLLYNAASSGDTAILGLLLRSGLNVNDTITGGDHPINAALFYRTVATVKMLVENGANVNCVSRSFNLAAFNGFTPLMFAAVNNDKASFYYLLEHGADPDMKNENGYTALMLLQQAEEDDPAMTKALLNHGADASVKNPAGKDALYYAMQKGNTQSVAILKKHSIK